MAGIISCMHKSLRMESISMCACMFRRLQLQWASKASNLLQLIIRCHPRQMEQLASLNPRANLIINGALSHHPSLPHSLGMAATLMRKSAILLQSMPPERAAGCTIPLPGASIVFCRQLARRMHSRPPSGTGRGLNDVC